MKLNSAILFLGCILTLGAGCSKCGADKQANEATPTGSSATEQNHEGDGGAIQEQQMDTPSEGAGMEKMDSMPEETTSDDGDN